MANLNLSIFNFIHGLSGHNFFVDAIGIISADYLPYIIGIIFFFLVFSQNGWRAKAFLFIEATIAVILSRGIITEALRFFYYSPRPFEALHFQSLIPESGSSLPSGHMTFFFALSMVIFFYNRRWGIWYLALSAIIGVARIFVGVHWPSDIIAGTIIGLLCGLGAHYAMRKYHKELAPPESA